MPRKVASQKKENHVAAILSRLRSQNNWTLAEVHRRTGVSISTLSKIENNLANPTYDVMSRISAGLGIDFVELLGEQAPVFAPGMRAVTRAGQGLPYETPIGRYLAIGAELAAKSMQPMIVTVPPKKKGAQFKSSHSGEEFLFVVEGTVEFFLEPYAPLILNQGDSVYYHGSTKHGFAACGDKEAKILCICLMGNGDLDGHISK